VPVSIELARPTSSLPSNDQLRDQSRQDYLVQSLAKPTFAEPQDHTMDRQEMLNALSELGFPTASLTDAVPDEELAKVLEWCQGKGEAPETADHAEGDDDEPADEDSDSDEDTSDSDSADSDDDRDQDTDDHADEYAEGSTPEGDLDEDTQLDQNTPPPAEESGDTGIMDRTAGSDPQERPGEPTGSQVDRGPDAQQHVMQEGIQAEEGQEHTDHDDMAGTMTFAEMTREEMVAALQKDGEPGHSEQELNGLSDDELEALYNSSVAGDTEEPGQEPTDDMAEGVMDRDQMVAQLVSHGHTEDDLKALSDEEVKALYDAENGQGVGVTDTADHAEFAEDDQAAAGNGLPNDPANATSAYDQNQPPPGGVLLPQKAVKMSEQAATIKQVADKAVQDALNTHLAPAMKVARDQLNQVLEIPKKKNLSKFCETLVREGRLLRRDVPTVYNRLLRASEVAGVRKFSDKKNPGKTIEKTELQLQLDELANGAIVASFAERIGEPMCNPNTEIQKIKNHVRRFSEQFRKNGQTVSSVVGAYKIARKKNPQLTAEEHIPALKNDVA
jgi:hypothetical protein